MENQKQVALIGKDAVKALRELQNSEIASEEFLLQGTNLCDIIVSLSDVITAIEMERLPKVSGGVIAEKVCQIVTIANIIREMFRDDGFAALQNFAYYLSDKEEFLMPELPELPEKP
jgi:hypothetical protein